MRKSNGLESTGSKELLYVRMVEYCKLRRADNSGKTVFDGLKSVLIH